MEKKGTVYFFTGLAGAGKTTIGGLFYERLKKKSPDAILIDGDQARLAAGHSTAAGTVLLEDRYTTQARKAGAFESFQACKRCAEQGRDVVICSIAMYTEVRTWNRENIENYREIYIKVDRDVLLRRNQKGLYTAGKDVVGMDIPFDEPKRPDFVIENNGRETPEAIVTRLEEALGRERA